MYCTHSEWRHIETKWNWKIELCSLQPTNQALLLTMCTVFLRLIWLWLWINRYTHQTIFNSTAFRLHSLIRVCAVVNSHWSLYVVAKNRERLDRNISLIHLLAFFGHSFPIFLSPNSNFSFSCWLVFRPFSIYSMHVFCSRFFCSLQKFHLFSSKHIKMGPVSMKYALVWV